MTSNQAASQEPSTKVAAFFDLDKTIIATSSASAFSRPFYAGGLLSRRAIVSSAYAHFLFMVGGANADQTERMRVQLSNLITGWPVEQVSAVVSETLHQYIDPFVYAEALELIERHRDQGHDIVIVSASGAEVVFPIANMLGATHAVATRMEIVDGRYTGTIEFYAYGENKAKAIRDLAQEHGYDLNHSYAYSDSITDIPMLEEVGNAYTVNADRAFRQVAHEQGWTSLVFQRPVALRKASMQRNTALGVTVLAGASALVWVLARSRRRRRSK